MTKRALATWIERANAPGQLSVVVLSDHLHSSWAVPLEPDDRLHLGASLACFGPGAGSAATLLPAGRFPGETCVVSTSPAPDP
jgi:hypothetical protein